MNKILFRNFGIELVRFVAYEAQSTKIYSYKFLNYKKALYKIWGLIPISIMIINNYKPIENINFNKWKFNL